MSCGADSGFDDLKIAYCTQKYKDILKVEEASDRAPTFCDELHSIFDYNVCHKFGTSGTYEIIDDMLLQCLRFLDHEHICSTSLKLYDPELESSGNLLFLFKNLSILPGFRQIGGS